jgi:hypothetical protein
MADNSAGTVLLECTECHQRYQAVTAIVARKNCLCGGILREVPKPERPGLSETQHFTEWVKWSLACHEAGLKGPYTISGQLHMSQFVGDAGTAAMWNSSSGTGLIFGDAAAERPA